ncbi:hypothetical protein CAL12_22360 [Bordetella genomosp. 8]|uniref:Glyoxalase-like domain-containing protein n=1 Tax=Bordetella genomosp. 8 TaxID=1416806 RepID=A0A1W6YQC5_9BORD|nr:VOC family protein [Bordetella genomosp. 8]ARP83292.1 hypothetical protein CAL12_22360 [Bordetella genomosp. 8]
MATGAGRTELDHAVIMVRDRLEQAAPHFERQGYTLSETEVHNLGSWNRLMVLEHSYVELLGWPPGKPPARKEIADSPLGLEALVLRTEDAEATYERLRAAGYAVNPVQVLTRPAQVGGKTMEARFHTVRFAEQPIPGIRLYFCRHLTPECVWQPALMQHANGARAVVEVRARAQDPAALAARFAEVADSTAHAAAGGAWLVPLGHARLRIEPAPAGQGTALDSLTLVDRDGRQSVLDTDFDKQA